MYIQLELMQLNTAVHQILSSSFFCSKDGLSCVAEKIPAALSGTPQLHITAVTWQQLNVFRQ